jgi:hypothetical protein
MFFSNMVYQLLVTLQNLQILHDYTVTEKYI